MQQIPTELSHSRVASLTGSLNIKSRYHIIGLTNNNNNNSTPIVYYFEYKSSCKLSQLLRSRKVPVFATLKANVSNIQCEISQYIFRATFEHITLWNSVKAKRSQKAAASCTKPATANLASAYYCVVICVACWCR